MTFWTTEKETFRGVWEAKCKVAGCGMTTRLEGEWLPNPLTPQFFYTTSGRNREFPGGWVYFRHGYLSYPEVYYERAMFCPDHAPIWLAYCKEVEQWKSGCKVDRKTWWETVMVSITAPFRPPPKPPMPVSPFGPLKAKS